MKSLLISVFFPAWMWTRQPHLKFLYGSYDLKLSTRDSVKTRRVIQSAWYQNIWGRTFRLVDDQNQKTKFENDRGGFRQATSTGAGITGEGGDIIVADDPQKAKDAFNPPALAKINEEWWDGTMSSRGNNPETVKRIVVQQRLHEIDTTGHILTKQQIEGSRQYDLLVLPAWYEPREYVCLGGLDHDLRTETGEALHPERFDDRQLREIAIDMDEQQAAGQMQQRPAPLSGVIWLESWWAQNRNRYNPDSPFLDQQAVARWISWDTAIKDKVSSDPSAYTVWDLLPDYRIRPRWAWDGRIRFHQLVDMVEQVGQDWNYDGKLVGILIEDKANGTAAYDMLTNAIDSEIADLLVLFMPVESKTYRARQASVWAARGRVELPGPSPAVPWLARFEHQLYTFPASVHDDLVDTMTQVILYLANWLAKGWHAQRDREREAEQVA
jgi:phage terminase large subunit-like protein